MAQTGTSLIALDDPQFFESPIQTLIRLTERGLLVWRVSRHNPKRFEAFPSDEIKTREDYELRVGRRLTGATVGYPVDTREEDRYLWLRITDGTGEQYYVEYHDAPTPGLKALVKQLHSIAKSECGKGSITPMPLYG